MKKEIFKPIPKEFKGKDILVHRMVAISFVPNPNNYPYVNHKDGNRSNNHEDNLEWVAEGGDQELYSTPPDPNNPTDPNALR